MSLVHWRHNCPDELVADMYQYYNLDILSSDVPLELLSTLAAQLPRNSRVKCFDNPDNEWTDEAFILRDLEYVVRVFATSFGGKGKKQEHILSPLERKLKEEKHKIDLENVKRAKSILGIKCCDSE